MNHWCLGQEIPNPCCIRISKAKLKINMHLPWHYMCQLCARRTRVETGQIYSVYKTHSGQLDYAPEFDRFNCLLDFQLHHCTVETALADEELQEPKKAVKAVSAAFH